MIEKFCHVAAFDGLQQNIFVLPDQELFKTASIQKTAGISAEIADAIDSLEREPGHKYVLVNGMGAGEFWSSNRNGDFFPESSLKHAGEDYGYRTFLSGHNFIHHQNKDPEKAVGSIKMAHYNERMHRVEILLDTDMRKLAKSDPEIYEKVANGEPVDVSMGSRCDFDVCSICSNRAATRAEYCSHLKLAMNQVLGDGRKVYAYTPHPKFFDMSYVTKGADVTAKALHYLDKAASDATAPSLPKSEVNACPDPGLHEEVSCEPAWREPSFDGDLKAACERAEDLEPRIPGEVLERMAKVGFNEAISTCSHLGIVLSPAEYQHLTLASLDMVKAARDLETANAVIDPPSMGSWFDPSIKPAQGQIAAEKISAEVGELLVRYVENRSAFEPYMSLRVAEAMDVPAEIVEKVAESRGIEKRAEGILTPSLAAALALGYIVYRRGIPAINIDEIKKTIHDPEVSKRLLAILVPIIAGGAVVDRILKFEPETQWPKPEPMMDGVDEGPKVAGVNSEVLLPVGATYLYSAYAKRKAQEGRPVSGLEHMVADYPLPVSLGLIGGGQAIKRSLKGTMGKRGGMILDVMNGVEKKADFATDVVMGFGSGAYRARPSGLLGLTADAVIASGIGVTASGVKKLVSKKKTSNE